MATIDLGKIKFTWRGAFSTSNTYEADDVVSHSGSSWIYVNATSKTGTNAGAPSNSNTTHWNLMADGTSPLTTAGDVMTHDGSNSIRLPVGSVGQSLQVTSSNTLGYSNQKGFEGIDALESNVPLYANTTNTTIGGTDGKRPWLARYNGKSGATEDWIPQEPFANPHCSPVKRGYDELISTQTCLFFLNTNYELMKSGYMHHGIGVIQNTNYLDQVQMIGNLSMENGGMANDEKFVRFWYCGGSLYVLTNKGNVWVAGENSGSQLGLAHTTDVYQLVRNPFLGPDATNNGVSCEVSCIVVNDARGYQGYGNTHAFFILHDGRVMACGWGGSGSHGLGNTNAFSTPTIVSGLTNIVMMSAGYDSTYAVDSSGNAFHTGTDRSGSSSLGSTRTSFAQMTAVQNCEQILNGTTYYYNAGVDATSFYINTSGDLFGIGNAANGQLGQGNTTDSATWVQIGGSENFSAVQTAGNASTMSIVAWLGNSAGQDGPGDMYTYTIANRTGMGFRTFGYNAHGQQMVGDTTANSSVRTPSTGTFGDYHNTVTSSADGTVSKTPLTFPSNNMIACFPFRTSGYNSPGWWGLDAQGRLWLWGKMSSAYEYRANTGGENFTKAFLYPAPMQHTLTGQNEWWVGDSDQRFEEIVSFGHYYNGYWTHIARTTKGEVWMIGNNIYYQHGTSQNLHYHFWHKRNP